MTRKIFIQKERTEAQTVLAEAVKVGVEEMERELTPTEIVGLIDDGLEMKVLLDDLTDKFDIIKKLLLKTAKEQKWKTYKGTVGEVKIGSSSTSTMTPKELAKVLHNVGKGDMLESLLTVRIGDAKKYIGETFLSPYLKTKSEEYGTVSIKKKK